MLSKVNRVKRCNRENIKEMTKIFETINNRVKILVDKIFRNKARLEENENRELQQLLRAQARLTLLTIEPGSGSVQASLYNNQCHRVVHLRERVKELERRYQFRILDRY
jgi:hypothetical protein